MTERAAHPDPFIESVIHHLEREQRKAIATRTSMLSDRVAAAEAEVNRLKAELDKPIMCDACKVKEASLWWCADCDSDHHAYVKWLQDAIQADKTYSDRLREALREILSQARSDGREDYGRIARAALEGK